MSEAGIIRVDSLAKCKRLLSRIITQLQKKEITGQEAKDLTYLLVSYLQLHKGIDFENRIADIESMVKVKNGLS